MSETHNGTHKGHTLRVKLDFSDENGERIMRWMREHQLVRDCPNEDHAPDDAGTIPTKLGSEVFLMLAGMVGTNVLRHITSLRLAEDLAGG